MQNFISRSALIIATLLFFVTEQAYAQSFPDFEDGFYCVVGTFRFENNARAYSQSLIARGFSTRISIDPATGLNYVHLGKAPSKENALTTALDLRNKADFKDAWVKSIGQEISNIAIQPVFKDLVEPLLQTPQQTGSRHSVEIEISNTEVFLHLYNATNDKLVDGTVEIIDTERSRLIEKTEGNNYYVLPDPKSNSKRITMIGNVFGYRKVQNEITYPLREVDESNPNIEMVGTIVMVRFDMVRYVKGDINVLYNVYFYHDAAVMQPESKYELNNLLDMLLENPRYRIKLHGHTNGSHTGKYFLPGEKRDLFSMTNAHEGFGTAKILAAKRAEVIKEYLVNRGIDGRRIEIKSWGGKKPLYDKHGENANRNLRVEVEILDQ